MSHGQFCSIARALEVLGGRWSLLVIRELLCGSRRFSEIRRGVPRISRTVLSERLQALAVAGTVARVEGDRGPEYELTQAGLELAIPLMTLGEWGQKWLPRNADDEDLDLESVLVDMERRVEFELLPRDPFVVRFEVKGHRPRFLLLRTSEASFCARNPGFDELVRVRTNLACLIAWWRGDVPFEEARRMGLLVDGPKELVRQFPKWFGLYLLAGTRPANRSPEGKIQANAEATAGLES